MGTPSKALSNVASANESTASVNETVSELDRLRRQIAVMSGRPDRPSIEVSEQTVDVLPVPDALADLLPHRGIAKGSVLSVGRACSVLVSMIASVSASGGQVGIVGMANLNLGAVVEWGGDLSRIATVPQPGVDPIEVASVLLDGMDLVVLGLKSAGMRGLKSAGMKSATVPPSRARVVMGRVRKQSSALIVVGDGWPGAHLRIDTEVMAYRHAPGVDAIDLSAARSGYGRIGGLRLKVRATDRSRRVRSGEIDVVTTGFGPHQTVALAPAHTRGAVPRDTATGTDTWAVAN